MKNILLLGATGSIGDSVLKVISQNEDSFNLYGIAAGKNNTKVEEIIKNFSPLNIFIDDQDAFKLVSSGLLNKWKLKHHNSGLSDEDIEKMVKDAEANAEDDKKFEELVKTKNNADMLVHATRKTGQESDDKLSDDEKDQIEKVVVGLEEAISSEDINNIETATKALNDVLTPLTDKLYSQDQAQAENSTEEAPNDDAENTVDAEYECQNFYL